MDQGGAVVKKQKTWDINGIAFVDDSQVISLACTKGWGDAGKIVLVVDEVNP